MSVSDDPPDDDLVAAEYVLGTLDADERAAADTRRAGDRVFAAQVTAWEERLVPLSESTRDVDPSVDLWPPIVRRIGLRQAGPSSAGPSGAQVTDLARSLVRWKRATAGISALAACLAVVVAVGALRDRGPPSTLIAVLEKSGEQPAYLMKANLGDRTVSVKPVAATPPAGRSYELWIIDPAIGPPKSLGLLGQAAGAHPLPPVAPSVLAGAVYAVTDEPLGGSPTGAPSGPPVFMGHLVSDAF